MAFHLSNQELEKELSTLISWGLVGNSKDFFHWIRMEIKRKFRDDPDVTLEAVEEALESMKARGMVQPGHFNAREYVIADNSPLAKKIGLTDAYSVIGDPNLAPLQFVRTRLEYFLKANKATEEEVMDISIGTVEAIENAVKYGDGNLVEVKYSIDKSKLFNISLINSVKDFDLQADIERGKFSSTATLMRGMMVMEKLFDSIDLDIVDEHKQARFFAKKKLS